MKKFMTALAALLIMTVSAKAMSYEQARDQALFLTDKMAYELNLTDAQYEAAYEINLDYLMGVNSYDEVYGDYWTRRNLDLSYILLDWQYRAFCEATYFYRPLYWSAGYWHFGIYARYPHRDYFFFDRPRVYVGYRGGHSWNHNGGRSWYKGRDFGASRGNNHFGMRDGFDRGDYGRGRNGSMGQPGNNNRQGTVNRGNGMMNRNGATTGRNGSFGNRNQGTTTGRGNGTFNRNGSMGERNQGTQSGRSINFGTRNSQSRMQDNATQRGQSTSRRNSFTSRESSTRTTVTRPSTTPSTPRSTQRSTERTVSRPSSSSQRSTFSPSRSNSSSSFGGSHSSSSSRGGSSVSHSSGPSSSHGGGGGHAGGGSFGGRR